VASTSNEDRSFVRSILFVSCVADLYGAERSLLEIVSELSPSWKAHFILTARGRYSSALECAKFHFDVVHVPTTGLRDAGIRGLFSILRLAWIIRTRRASLVHANLQWAVPLVAASCRLTGVPFIAHLRNIVTHAADVRSAKRFRRASAIICISQAVRDSAYAAGLLSSEQHDRICIIPDGRSLSDYRQGDRARIRAELGIEDDIPLIGMVARIDPMKGQHTFLEMAALVIEHIPSARFLLAGDVMQEEHGKYLKMLKRRCEDPRLKQCVTFLGYRTDIPDVLAALDCFVHPSARGAFVSVLIEAMATGLPIVVPEVDGIPECVGRDGAAELISSLQPAAFAKAVVEILHEPARKARMSVAARERAKRYDAASLARETEQVFESCL
jgi:glycosyltransferase involved in cell wall biosynthesis